MARITKLLAIILLLFALSTSVVFGEDGNTIYPDSISLNKSNVNMGTSETYTLKVSFSPSDATEKTVTWSSSNTKVVEVSDSGKLKSGTSYGSATVKARTSNGLIASCEVNVNMYLEVGETGRVVNNADYDVEFTSSKPSVATVENTGDNTCRIKGISSGNTLITSSGNGRTNTFWVVVTEPAKVELNKSDIEIEPDGSYTLKATVTPSNAIDKTVTWSSDDTSVAQVSSKGVVRANGYGKATIKAKLSNGSYDTCVVTVKKPTTMD